MLLDEVSVVQIEYRWSPGAISHVRPGSFARSSLCKTLPEDILYAQSFPAFRRKLKMHLFRQSYPGITLSLSLIYFVVLEICHLCRHRNCYVVTSFPREFYYLFAYDKLF